MLRSILGLVLLAIGVLGGSPIVSGPINAGVASATNSDTIEMHGQRIRLHGIDAPESGQLNERKDGEQYRRGHVAALALSDGIGRRPVNRGKRRLGPGW